MRILEWNEMNSRQRAFAMLFIWTKNYHHFVAEAWAIVPLVGNPLSGLFNVFSFLGDKWHNEREYENYLRT